MLLGGTGEGTRFTTPVPGSLCALGVRAAPKTDGLQQYSETIHLSCGLLQTPDNPTIQRQSEGRGLIALYRILLEWNTDSATALYALIE